MENPKIFPGEPAGPEHEWIFRSTLWYTLPWREIFMAELSEVTQPFGCRMRMKPIASEIEHHQIRRKHVIAAPRFLNTEHTETPANAGLSIWWKLSNPTP